MANPWIESFKPRPEAELRLFCFAYAGGSAQIFRPWGKKISPKIELCPLQLPGRGQRLQEPPYRHWQPLIQKLTQDLHDELDKPFALFGHSMGALLAFELARALQTAYSVTPEALFASAFASPQIYHNPELPTSQLSDGEFLEAIRDINGTPPQVLEDPELMGLLLPALRGDFAIVESYRYQSGERLEYPIHAFCGLADPKFPCSSVEPWRDLTRSDFSIQRFEGGHFFIHEQTEVMVEAIQRNLVI